MHPHRAQQCELRGTVAPTEVCPSLITALVMLTNLQDDSADVRRAALEALSSTGEAAALHIGAILPLLQDENTGARCAALQAIGRTGKAAEHIGAIIPLLQDESAFVRRAALIALGDTAKAAEHIGAILHHFYKMKVY